MLQKLNLDNILLINHLYFSEHIGIRIRILVKSTYIIMKYRAWGANSAKSIFMAMCSPCKIVHSYQNARSIALFDLIY